MGMPPSGGKKRVQIVHRSSISSAFRSVSIEAVRDKAKSSGMFRLGRSAVFLMPHRSGIGLCKGADRSAAGGLEAMYWHLAFTAAIGAAAALVIGPLGGLVSGLILAGAGYTARQVMRDD